MSAPGSATHLFVNQLVAKAGLKPTDFSAIGVGTTQTALTAFERGEVDALSLFDPIIADLELKGTINILADARDSKGTQAIFGGPYASGSLYAAADWIPKNEAAVRGCAGAIQEAVTFLKGATPEQAIGALEKGMCAVGMDVCTSAFTRNKDAFNHDCRITPEMADTVQAHALQLRPGHRRRQHRPARNLHGQIPVRVGAGSSGTSALRAAASCRARSTSASLMSRFSCRRTNKTARR